MTRLLTIYILLSFNSFGQNYTSYFTGNNDIVTSPTGGVCLMGGATEHDEAMKWFLQRASGGDILVLRTSGSNGYNDYMFNQLGITVNSVETIVCNNASASNESYIHQRIEEAEGIWFAGGDQWNYISYWRGTPIDSLINLGITQRNIVIGGTSAGMAIQGSYYFSAENGTITSAAALNDPYNFNVTPDGTPFINNGNLQNVITDTHYDNPDRRGRHITFLARIFSDFGVPAKGIACDEYTSVCILPNGTAHVYGDYPAYDDNAYFIQVNCDLPDYSPEACTSAMPLDWNRGGSALKVYEIKGTNDGAKTFDLSNWLIGNGGTWKHWAVFAGTFVEDAGLAPTCSVGVSEDANIISLYPNPTSDKINMTGIQLNVKSIEIKGVSGKSYKVPVNDQEIDLEDLDTGLYFLSIEGQNIPIIKK